MLGEVERVERVDHGGRRVGGAEVLQAAALVARGLREREVAGLRGHEGIDQAGRR